METIIGGVSAALAGISLAIAIFSLIQELINRRRRKKEPTLQDRISSLSKNLESAVAAITEIEEEIAKRKNLAVQLEEDIKRYNQLREISQAQVEAIAQTLSIPIKKESLKSTIYNAITSLVIALAIFALGYFTGSK